jgi:hypothetical protein
VNKATFFNVVSRDFLLPYSLTPDIPPIPIHNHHLGDINNTLHIKTIHETNIIAIKRLFIRNKQNNKINAFNITIHFSFSRKLSIPYLLTFLIVKC